MEKKKKNTLVDSPILFFSFSSVLHAPKCLVNGGGGGNDKESEEIEGPGRVPPVVLLVSGWLDTSVFFVSFLFIQTKKKPLCFDKDQNRAEEYFFFLLCLSPLTRFLFLLEEKT